MKAYELYRATLNRLPCGEILAKISCNISKTPGIEYEPDGKVVCEGHPTPPSQAYIHSSGYSCGFFGSAEAECAAWAIVQHCLNRGAWVRFTREEIETIFRSKHPRSTFAFDQMRVRGCIYSDDNGNTFRVTTGFIERAMERPR